MDRKRNRPGSLAINGSLISYINPQSAAAGQYRSIRNNIRFAAGNRPMRSIVVTSPSEGEGKTTTAVNLAICTAMRGDRVLLIDAHGRRPALQTIFNPPSATGLSNVLAGQIEPSEAVCHTEIGRLNVLPSGPMLLHAMEMLDSKAMQELAAYTADNYDLVVYDGAPVLESPDMNTLAGGCDGVVLVLSGGKTQRDKALEAKKSLEFAGAHLIGAILNRKTD